MLSDIDLNVRLDKKTYKSESAALKKELSELQLVIKERQIPVVIVFDGFSAAGKGRLMGKVAHSLDPRYYKVHTMGKATDNDFRRPSLWGYWTKLPAGGEIVIFDKSWNRALMSEQWRLNHTERKEFYNDINAFERQMRDDGVLVIKLFLHISRKEQYRRLKVLENNPITAWRVNTNDFEQNKAYDEYVKLFDTVLTSSEGWHIIEADDRRYATIKAYKAIISEIKLRLERLVPQSSASQQQQNIPQLLSAVDPARELSDESYRKKLVKYQNRLSELEFKLYSKQRAVAIVYEGWDAAGKGGNIKRLTEKLDPRGYEVVPISAPSRDELAHHYLWRFYQKLPKDGHIAIFDRSWYGRVLVERVEGFATPEQWRRAFNEINEMERYWTNHGVIIIKFWLHIDKNEQLRRFNARLENPEKRYKITEEDWRNREKWELYEEAVNEMLAKTDTPYAHWNIVPANNKKFARLHVLEHVIAEIEKGLDGGYD